MKNRMFSGILLGIFLSGAAAFVVASEADELTERARSLRSKAKVVAETAEKQARLGNEVQADRLKQESIMILESAEQLELNAKELEKASDRPRIGQPNHRERQLPPQPKILQQAKGPDGVRAEAHEPAKREAGKHVMQHSKPDRLPQELHAQAEMLDAAARRIHHLRIAAENLRLADAHDPAQDIMRKADSMEREVQAGRKRLEAEVQAFRRREQGAEHVHEMVHALKEEIAHLRAEVKELHMRIEKR